MWLDVLDDDLVLPLHRIFIALLNTCLKFVIAILKQTSFRPPLENGESCYFYRQDS